MGDNLLVWGIVLLGILWLAQLIWLYWDSQNRQADPIRTVSGAATFFVFAAPVAVFSPGTVDSVGRFWERLSAPIERAFGSGGARGSASGHTPARLLIDGDSKPLSIQRVRLGRYPNNEVVLDHSTVSAYHAEIIQRPDGRHEVVDRESRNGTRVNGALIRNQVLRDGDLITLGAASMHYLGASTETEQAVPLADDYEDDFDDPRQPRGYSQQTVEDDYDR
ncbi:MAG: FHA domain-containing protein [Chloroflexota bacterium]|nr:FHA domain-containing protein [Chloroflexota bacterium]